MCYLSERGRLTRELLRKQLQPSTRDPRDLTFSARTGPFYDFATSTVSLAWLREVLEPERPLIGDPFGVEWTR
jgi:hypothetical protein